MIASEVPAVGATFLGPGLGVSAAPWPFVRLTWFAPIDWSIWLILPIEFGGLLETTSSFCGFFPALIHVVLPLPPNRCFEVFWIAGVQGLLQVSWWIRYGLTSLLDSFRQPSEELFFVSRVIASHAGHFDVLGAAAPFQP